VEDFPEKREKRLKVKWKNFYTFKRGFHIPSLAFRNIKKH